MSKQPDTSPEELEAALSELKAAADGWSRSSLEDRSRLMESCLQGVGETAEEWVNAATEAKGIAANSPARAEDLTSGPIAVARCLRLLLCLFQRLRRGDPSPLESALSQRPGGKQEVRVIPAIGPFEQLGFMGFQAHVRLRNPVSPEEWRSRLQQRTKRLTESRPGVALILGAGNVSSIPALDAFYKLFHEGRVVLLKFNPVNDYLGPIFKKAFASLIKEGCLRLIHGGAEVGAAAVNHPLVDEVHVTGSIETHDRIAWGPPGEERERRKRENDPALQKPITSELGNVSPWIIAPGNYSTRELAYQAENTATSILNNVSFNCVATKVIVTAADWPQREEFLDRVQGVLRLTPRRKAYYPGAADRFRRFLAEANAQPAAKPSGDLLPWTLLRDVDPDESPLFFQEESFTPICVETSLPARSPEEFLSSAVDFVNDRLWGTLSAAMTLPTDFRGRAASEELLQTCVDRLRYGVVGINHWPAMGYAMMTPPWGGFPDASLQDAQSGLGWVHNIYLLEDVEKTVLEGPLSSSSTPIWFPTHPRPEPICRRMLQLYLRPTWWNATRLVASALGVDFS
ncbi:MAG: aldehyde dehydrogenase family protein [Planctomycetales bacterium]